MTQTTLNTAQRTQIRAAWEQAHSCLDQAVTGLREASQEQELPRGLLARAAAARYRAVVVPAQREAAQHQAALDLTEVFESATRCGMRLFLTDYHLEAARWALTCPNLATTEAWASPMGEHSAAEHVQHAKELMAQTGYRWPEAAVAHLECYL